MDNPLDKGRVLYESNLNGNMQKVAAFLSVTEAAPLVGMTRQAFWQQIKSGSVKAIKVGETYVVAENEVRRLRRKRISLMKRNLLVLEGIEEGGK